MSVERQSDPRERKSYIMAIDIDLQLVPNRIRPELEMSYSLGQLEVVNKLIVDAYADIGR
jgi:hypothetical protein